MNTYPLKGVGVSPYCKGKWNPDSKTFSPTNSLDVLKCCLDSCDNRIDFCFKQCDTISDNKRCYRLCNELIDDCKNGCTENKSVGTSTIRSCAKKYGCDTVDCIKSKRDEIIRCCNTECSESEDCAYCNDFFDHVVSLYTPIPRKKGKNEGGKDHSAMFLVALLILVLFTIIFIN